MYYNMSLLKFLLVLLSLVFCSRCDQDLRRLSLLTSSLPRSVADSGDTVQLVHYQAETWQDAFTICKDGGGRLSIVNDLRELDEIMSIFNSVRNKLINADSADYLIIGFQSQVSDGEYLTVEGDPLDKTGYTHWSENEPNSDGTCGALATTGDIGLADIPCDKKYAFVCEFKRYS